MRRIGIVLLLLQLPALLFADGPGPLGSWRVHLPYTRVQQICETPGKIYCATPDGLFALNTKDWVTERLSPINGFSSYRARALAYHTGLSTLVIAYEDGRIDLVKNGRIEKNDDIYRKTIIGEKIVYRISLHGNIAYLCTSFGLLELDLVKNEIRNSYQNIGPLGSIIDVYASAVLNDSIYISTQNGIMRGSLSASSNLADYNNWSLSRSASIRSNHIASFNGRLYAEIDSQLYRYNPPVWAPYEPGANRIITNISVQHNKLVIGAFGDSIFTVDDADNRTYTPINIMNECLLDAGGEFWYASPANGLVQKTAGTEINYFPNGPRAVSAYQFVNAYGDLWMMAGSFVSTTYAPTFNGIRYDRFDNFGWKAATDHPLTNPLYDYTVAAYHKNSGRLFIGTHGKGLLQINNGVPYRVWDETNSPLRPRAGLYTIVRGLAFDNRNNLWVSNFDVDSALLMLSPAGNWTAYKLPVQKTGKIAVDARGNKWVITPQSSTGIIAYRDNGTTGPADDDVITIGTTPGNGNLPTSAVNDIAFTKSGELLIGTDEGYVKIRTPNNVFTGGNFDAQRVIVAVEENSNLGGYLLGSEVINCIVVDGGDRRWFGTNKGAWLFDSDGETLIHHFTVGNSPLMSDNVLSIGIMESTGEVFFGTDRGTCSFRADALPGSNSLLEPVIYPNPVKPDYTGDIAITGMPDNTLLKITDINGRMVWQTFSNGGMATWNGRSFDGTRVATGVYLVFCINTEGTETSIGKILFVN